MTIKEPYMHTTMEIWFPKYSSQYKNDGDGERSALLSVEKVNRATPIILVKFTKAKHLIGQRFYIHKSHAQSFPQVSNGRIMCYDVPMSILDTWELA